MEVLDTAALLSWPLEMLMQGICANSQLDEVQRLSPSRHLMIESQGPRFETPNPAAIAVATEASQETGDVSGVSNVDVDGFVDVDGNVEVDVNVEVEGIL